MTDSFSERAARRRNWGAHIYPLANQPGDDLSKTTTPERRLEMVWELTARMWELTARPRPSYTRATMPVRIVPFLGRAELITNKRAAGRTKDLADLEELGER